MSSPFLFQREWQRAVLDEWGTKATFAEISGHFDVYDDAFWIRFSDVLELYLPKFSALAANDWDENLMNAFQKRPPTSWTVVEITEIFVSYLREIRHPHAEIAEKEWATEQCIAAGCGFDSFKDQLLNLDQDQWSHLILQSHPSLRQVGNWIVWSLGGGVVQELILTESEQRAFRLLKDQVPLSQWEHYFGESAAEVLGVVLKQWTENGMIVGIKGSQNDH